MERQRLIYLLMAVAAGMTSGFLGIGGGVVLVPMMVGLLGIPQHSAHGTSVAIIVPIALSGAIPYAMRGDIDWALAAVVAVGGIFGAVIGAKLMMRVPALRLRQGFGWFLVVVSLLLLIGV